MNAVNALSIFFTVDRFSLFIGGFAVFFFALTVIYSVSFMKGLPGRTLYYAYLCLTLISSLGVVFARHLIVFLVVWGFLGLLLYLLIGFGRTERTAATAKKALIIVGGTDALMILGLALVFHLTGSFNLDEIHLKFDSGFAVLAYLCLASGALAKAGSMPFHSWVPDTAEDAPIPVTAYLPASLDKLLGIYFLARLSLQLFTLTPAMNMVLMILGSLTILFAVMMALVQHDLKRLLGYHAVSQVGYMVLGFGTGNPIAIAGGLFHMLNHAIYKSCLFFGAGVVEKVAGTTDLEKLGGLGRAMPLTFGSFLIAALAISGVPPLNGFASKWMIYQGLIEIIKSGNLVGVICLVAAMFGSALTLASFMKVIHAVFLGQPSYGQELWTNSRREPSLWLWGPMAILAILCVAFGVLAGPVPLRLFIFPSLQFEPALPGIWNAGLATGLIVAAILIGLCFYLLTGQTKTRGTDIFMGGELEKDNPDIRVSGVDFYHNIQNLSWLKKMYGLAERRRLDPYDLGLGMASRFTQALQFLHNGILSTYLAWVLLGAALLMLILMR